ncbi:hypothetical protein [uncultured Sneathiella sp.]|uniref:tetratricopeptide repeat protein n=1 Tax=uncultured Sneathiella sp. TaxID=879315 RepID=UPI0025923AFA|nr:hypothetical protein [uncultured Sneathiella sp.]
MKATRFSLAFGLVLLNAQVVQANFEKGQEALDQNDALAAIEEWQPVAKRGDARAQFALGQIFEKGTEGVEPDLVEAYTWFKLAAAQGHKEAGETIERLRAIMSTDDLRDAQARSFAALGFWYRDFTGQDEAAFQEAKAAAVVPEQSPSVTEETLAEQRAAAQRELIAQRKAEAEAKEKALEESRQAAILAAQVAAEEAKRQAEIRDKKIEEQRSVIAQKDAQQSQSSLDEAKARLADLMAKQQGGAEATGGSAIAAPVAVAVAAAAAAAVPKPAEKTLAPETNIASTPVSPEATEVTAAPKVTPAPQQAALATTSSNVNRPVASKSAESPLTQTKSETLTALKSLDGLNKEAVEEIFEQAKIADLNNAEAQSEIERSLVRIEALKWSLISGAKGDNAAPKLNKVLMSKMSPVQIAEANRLAGEWLIERQKQL